MTTPPARPKIYHITHVENLAAIIAAGELVSDATMIARGGPKVGIGMSSIKGPRLTVPVTCHTKIMVGDCVPFNYCPRSVMLYLIYRANHPELTFRGGQGPIVHLRADLAKVVDWANEAHRKWAFTDANARTGYCNFFDDIDDLDKLEWPYISTDEWQKTEIKEAKQAEFLIHEAFPWELVERIGVHSVGVQTTVLGAIEGAAHQPPVEVKRDWYY